MTTNTKLVCVVLVTHNRLQYTEKCVQALLADKQSEFELIIWDNASTDETPAYLQSLRDPRLKKVVLSRENIGATGAINRIWSATSLEYVAKVDNDCLVTPGWLRTLVAAHRDIPDLGAVACWHYRLEDFQEHIARRKIREVKGHKIFQHPFVCGTGFVLKRRTYREIGPVPEGSADTGLTGYFLKIARAGYLNGWYYPLVLQHHMDDVLSPYCMYRDDKSLEQFRHVTFCLRVNKIRTIKDRLRHRRKVVDNLLYGSPHVKAYYGWRRILRRAVPNIDKLLYHVLWVV